jgi:hypothetical protein
MSLPSFSGATEDHPRLLQYTCQLKSRVRPLLGQRIEAVGVYDGSHPEDVSTVLRGRPVVCLEFANMEMEVPKPEALLLRHAQQPCVTHAEFMAAP